LSGYEEDGLIASTLHISSRQPDLSADVGLGTRRESRGPTRKTNESL